MNAKICDYREVIDAVAQAGRDIPSLRVAELDPIVTPNGRYPFYVVTGKRSNAPDSNRRSVYISGGIHGDEPAGVWAVLGFLKRYHALPERYHLFDFTILPCINPHGYEYHTRENADGVDLNRQFRNPSPPLEVQHVKKVIGNRPFLLTMELHEDVDTPGFYLYELTRKNEPSWGHEMIARIGAKYAINEKEEIEGMPANGGLIHREPGDVDLHQIMERRSDWPQAFYHYANGSRHCYTTETPVFLDREDRVEIHLTAIDVALQKLWESSGRSRR